MFFEKINMRIVSLLSVALLVLVAFVEMPAAAPVAAQTTLAVSTPASASRNVHVVLMVMKGSEFLYEPEAVVVNVGDTIEWKNNDIYDHSVTSSNGNTLNSGDIKPGASWRYKAVKKGTYAYYCTFHPNMRGKLIVH